MIEIAELAIALKEYIEHIPVPAILVIVPGFIIALATVATVVATYLEEQIPTDAGHH